LHFFSLYYAPFSSRRRLPFPVYTPVKIGYFTSKMVS